MVMPHIDDIKEGQTQKSLGFLVQCNEESESLWSCYASVDLRLLKQKDDGEKLFFSRKFERLFDNKENKWGFTHFLSFQDVLEPDHGYNKDNKIIVEVNVVCDQPKLASSCLKRQTGFMGIVNQGATCYMNSLLQILYFTNKLRKAIYEMPTGSNNIRKRITMALQELFYELQFSNEPVCTKKLTESFGWTRRDLNLQHDTQEFLRLILDQLQNVMQGTSVEETLHKLFEGKMISTITCKNIGFTSSKVETFYDIQLNINGKKNLAESFQDYIENKMLDGDNIYNAGEHGLQVAEKGVMFDTFPPVLHLHLMRFQYDEKTKRSEKCFQRFEFPENVCLDPYLHSTGPEPANYTLHAVLVHTGDGYGGHYMVFINPKCDGEWWKFDDKKVTKCTKAEAIQQNFGGRKRKPKIDECPTAYMLVYIQSTEIVNVLEEVTENDIPQDLVKRVQNDIFLKSNNKEDSRLYVSVQVLEEDCFNEHQGHDLFDPEKAHFKVHKLKKHSTVEGLLESCSNSFKYPPDQYRLWSFGWQQKKRIFRPTIVDVKLNFKKHIYEIYGKQNPWYIFIETIHPEIGLQTLQPFHKNTHVLLFFKLYDPKIKKIFYCGYQYMPVTITVQKLIPVLNKSAGFPQHTGLVLYEEKKPNMVEKIETSNKPLKKVLEKLTYGVIIVFEKDVQNETSDLATCQDYFKYLFLRLDVTFCDKTIPNHSGFTIELSQQTTYDQLARAVAERLGTVPFLLQFFQCKKYEESPGNYIHYTFKGTLKNMLGSCKPKTSLKMFYQKLNTPINELKKKRCNVRRAVCERQMLQSYLASIQRKIHQHDFR